MLQFLTGAEVVVKAALDAGAKYFYGYPITPGTELLGLWVKEAEKNKELVFLQTEDEISAGFAALGSVLAGGAAFTATSGPGTVLMQDPLVMAEAMRVPLVIVIIQRGGPSSGTVIYSQQEVQLAIFGGNNEGRRLVYSPSNLSELYYYTYLSFVHAWQYRFPTIVLTDGYLMKTRQTVTLTPPANQMSNTPLLPLGANLHLPNIYTFEEELFNKNLADLADFEKMAKTVIESETFMTEGAEEIIIAHGIVGAAAKEAVKELRAKGQKVGLFRPITLNPFPHEALNQLAGKIKRFIIVESSLGQLERLVKNNLDKIIEIKHYLRPAMGIEVDEIVKLFYV